MFFANSRFCRFSKIMSTNRSIGVGYVFRIHCELLDKIFKRHDLYCNARVETPRFYRTHANTLLLRENCIMQLTSTHLGKVNELGQRNASDTRTPSVSKFTQCKVYTSTLAASIYKL